MTSQKQKTLLKDSLGELIANLNDTHSEFKRLMDQEWSENSTLRTDLYRCEEHFSSYFLKGLELFQNSDFSLVHENVVSLYQQCTDYFRDFYGSKSGEKISEIIQNFITLLSQTKTKLSIGIGSTNGEKNRGATPSETINVKVQLSARDFDGVLEKFHGYKPASEWKDGDNQNPVELTREEYDIVVHSLAIASNAAKIPNWSTWLVAQLKGVLAVLEALEPVISKLGKGLSLVWNGALKKLRKALKSLETSDSDEQ